jgi:hypothetical protein
VVATLVTTLVTVFGAAPDPNGAAVLGVLTLVALATVAAALTTFAIGLPGPDTGAVHARLGSLRRRAAAVGVVVVRDPDAAGRIRPRAPGSALAPA